MNTLLYHFGALGDFITTLPAVAAWKRLHKATITHLGKPAFGELARRAGYIDAVEDADSGSRAFLFRKNPDESQLRRFFAPFDAMLLFAAPGSPLIGNARACSQAIILSQPSFPATRIPAVDYHLSLVTEVSSLTVRQRTPVVSIPGTPAVPFFTGSRNGSVPVVAIHPGSGSAMKNWPMPGFLAVAEQLRSDGCAVLWFKGTAEKEIVYPAGDGLAAGYPLTECVHILSRCAVFLGNDSGMTHLAAAAGCPTIALFGPSDPAIWGPRGTGPVRIIRHPPECAPCHLKADIPAGCGGECMSRIHPGEVVAALKAAMGG
ncbi:MAG: glycosyltransferase family 9 protein [Chitinispirillaceae bacterium]|nr:glycosyltransferase family 9 protein [Chitinispirillaceae bacterium]